MNETLLDSFEFDFEEFVLPCLYKALPRDWLSEPIYYYFDIIEIRKFRSGLPIQLARAENFAFELATSIGTAAELVFCAALLIDDIVDQDILRSRCPAAHIKFGYSRAVASAGLALSAADELLSRALAREDLGAERSSYIRVELADANRRMMESFLKERRWIGTELSSEDLFDLFRDKTSTGTAALTAVSCCSSNTSWCDLSASIKAFSEQLGIAGQIKNDVYDFTVLSETREGASSDVRNGYMTFPVRKLIDMHTDRKSELTRLFRNRNDKRLSELIVEMGVFQLCRTEINSRVDKAIENLNHARLSQESIQLLTQWAECNRLKDEFQGRTGVKRNRE